MRWSGWRLLATTVLSGCALPGFALADAGSGAAEVVQAQGGRVVRFSIPSQDLDTAMTRLADQAGIRLVGASSDLAGKRSAGLSGDYTVTQALDTLLAGSGVGWRFSE